MTFLDVLFLKHLKIKSCDSNNTNTHIRMDMIFGSAARRLKEIQQTSPSPREESLLAEEDLLTKLRISSIHICDLMKAQEALKHLLICKHPIGLDIETYPLPSFANDPEAGLIPRKSKIRLIQLYDGSTTVFVFDLLKLGGIHILGQAIWKQPMIAHNAMFELKHLMHAGACPIQLDCTLLADRTLNGNRKDLRGDLGLSKSASLKDLAKELLNIDLSKEHQTSDWSTEDLSKEQIAYAALDATIPVRLFQRQKQDLEKRSLTRSYHILRNAQYPVAKMELCGIGFDVTQHMNLIAGWQEELDQLEASIFSEIGHNLNLNSSKQMGNWLTETLKERDLEQWEKTSKGHLSTSTPTFKLNEHAHVIFPKIVEFRHISKRISSFGHGMYKFIDIPENRLYGSFSLGNTITGRMASHHPNMQNMPRDGFRNLFCSQPGYSLIGLDYSQQELRVAAMVTGDPELLRIYKEGGDVHTNTAAAILKIPKETVSKQNRQLAKAVIFGLLYGQGAKGLAIYAASQYGVDMTEEQAQQHREALFRTYKGLRKWQLTTGKLVEITMKVRTKCGKERDFSREQQGYRYNAALNMPIQGAAAEITLHAITRLSHLLSDDCHLVNVIHDEILLEVSDARIAEIARMATEAMEEAFLDVFPESQPYIKGLVEAKVGKNWGETK